MSERENLILAHIFGRRKFGEREEARLLLFNPDGTEFIPGKERVGPAGPAGPAGASGASLNPFDVVPSAIDMSPDYPSVEVDCAGRTAVHVRKLTVPGTATISKEISITLTNLEIGTPYHIMVDNNSALPHLIMLTAGGYPAYPIVVAGQGRSVRMHLPPNQLCAIMSVYTGPTDRPLGVVAKPHGAPAFRRVTGNYTMDTQFDINPLIFVNSATPTTITLRDLNTADTWWVGEEAEVYQEGVGAVTIAAPAGSTLIRPGSVVGNFVMPGGRYSTVKLRCVDIAKWVLV